MASTDIDVVDDSLVEVVDSDVEDGASLLGEDVEVGLGVVDVVASDVDVGA